MNLPAEAISQKISPADLPDMSNRELAFTHAQLHKFWEKHFIGNTLESSDGSSREDVINGHLLLLQEMQSRGIEHTQQDELDKEAAAFLGQVKIIGEKFNPHHGAGGRFASAGVGSAEVSPGLAALKAITPEDIDLEPQEIQAKIDGLTSQYPEMKGTIRRAEAWTNDGQYEKLTNASEKILANPTGPPALVAGPYGPAGKALLGDLKHAPGMDGELYRGLGFSSKGAFDKVLMAHKKGAILDIPAMSATTKRTVADKFSASWNPSAHGIVYRIAKGARGIPVSLVSGSEQAEVIAGGVFRITNVSRQGNKATIDLEQIGVFEGV
jgi:hypothetical protein